MNSSYEVSRLSDIIKISDNSFHHFNILFYNVIYKRLVHTSDPCTFLLHYDLLTVVRNHNTTTQWTLNLKKPEFSLPSRLSIRVKKCWFDVLQRRTTSLKPSFVIKWRAVSRRPKTATLNIIWPWPKKRRSYDISSIWIREDSRPGSTTYEIWPISSVRHVTWNPLINSDHTTSYNVVLSSRYVFYVCTTFKEFFIKILIR